jgi:hypothetical protein
MVRCAAEPTRFSRSITPSLSEIMWVGNTSCLLSWLALRQGQALELAPLTLAVWFMDDGSRSRNAVYLNTQQFAMTDQMRLLALLKGQWGIEGH